MYCKISNTASQEKSEKALDLPLKYPKAYEKQAVINGLEEASILIVSMQNSTLIMPAVLVILPDGYREDWSIFQNISNTLNSPVESMD